MHCYAMHPLSPFPPDPGGQRAVRSGPGEALETVVQQ